MPAAFWLLPCAADAERLQEVIRTLARAHGAPVFDPHVTLHVADCPAASDIDAHAGTGGASCIRRSRWRPWQPVIRRPTTRRCSWSCRANARMGRAWSRFAAAWSGSWSTPSSATAASGQTIGALQRSIGHGPALASYPFHPHLSLLYGELPAPLRARARGASRPARPHASLRPDRRRAAGAGPSRSGQGLALAGLRPPAPAGLTSRCELTRLQGYSRSGVGRCAEFLSAAGSD